MPSCHFLSTWYSCIPLFIQESPGDLPRSARRGIHLALKPYQPTHSITNHQTRLASPPHNSPWSSTRQSGSSVPWP